MQQPLFSIVIANFNYGRFLEEAIQSILTQSCQDFEVLVVDGGSTDNSVEIIRRYENRLAWWCSEKDKGQSDAFNKGFAQATGEYCFWVNADDILLPGTLAAAKRHLEGRPNCEWLAGNTIFFDQAGKIRWCARGPRWIRWLLQSGPIYVYGPSSIFKRSLLVKVAGFDEALHFTMDTDLWLRFAKVGARFDRLNHYCWGFRIHEASKTSHMFARHENSKCAEEHQRVMTAHARQAKRGVLKAQTLWKLVSGCYVRAFWDTWRWKGKSFKQVMRIG